MQLSHILHSFIFKSIFKNAAHIVAIYNMGCAIFCIKYETI